MRRFIYNLLGRLGYKIENKAKDRERKVNFLAKFNISENLDLAVKGYSFIQSLDIYYVDLRIGDSGNGITLEFDGVKIYVETYEELLIVNEIFVKCDYNFSTEGRITVIDIGTNIGLASIFFSKVGNVDKIYAFEPVLDTYNQALVNFELNDKMLKVEGFYNVGLGNTDRIDVFLFNKNVKGNTGIRGVKSTSFSEAEVVETEVIIKRASIEINKIISKNLGQKIVVKIDCEGAEYEIFDDLDEAKCLNNIDIILLEWHDNGSEHLEQILKKNGFSYFLQNLSQNTGMIYAYKR